jgi:UBX domain-containing protein 1
LDDPANGEFLRDLSRGRTPRELAAEASNDSNVVVGLIDKRNEDYVEKFTSFSGTGTSLGNRQNASPDGIFSTQSSPPEIPSNIGTITNIAVRLLNGKRQIVSIGLGNTVADLATHLQNNDEINSVPFRLMAGFPPRPLIDAQATIESAGLKGAQISMQKA